MWSSVVAASAGCIKRNLWALTMPWDCSGYYTDEREVSEVEVGNEKIDSATLGKCSLQELAASWL